MSKLDPALWRDMMAYLRHKHAPICRDWFEQLQPLGLDAGLLQVRTVTGVQQQYLQRQCLEPFTEAAQAVTGALVAVRFIAEPAHPGSAPAPGSAPGRAPGSGNTHGHAPGRPDPNEHSPPYRHTAGSREGLTREPRSGDRGWHEQPSWDAEFEADQIVLSPDYSFDNFISGPNSQLAYAASVAVANQPGTAYNPLFIHGGVGLGKTHLLQAICQKILQDRPEMQILYVSCDSFMNQFIECVQRGQMHQFRHRYRHVDVIVIDDIHFLANRERSQEEFFHTFNELYQSNRQIVLSSDAPPAEIPHLEERLISRFQWGLVANVTKPEYETRVAILRAKTKLRGMQAPDDVLSYIATRIDSNARELEGAITTVQAYAALQDQPINLALARQAMGEPVESSRSNQTTLQQIIDVVTEFYNVRLSDLQSRRRHKSVTEPRQVCMYLARKRTRFSLEEVGGYFGGRDHTTVMHSIRTVEDRASTDATFARQVEQMDQAIQRKAAEHTGG